jgi:hypothetical protein
MCSDPFLARAQHVQILLHRELDSDGDLIFFEAGPDAVNSFELLCGFHLDFILEPTPGVSASIEEIRVENTAR